MRRAAVLLASLCVALAAAPIAACGETGDSKLKNGLDLPPPNQLDAAGGTDDGSTEGGTAGGEDTGTPMDGG